jgi:hypothetical protein
MLSRQGQQSVVKDGYLPITPALAQEVLVEVGIAKPSSR